MSGEFTRRSLLRATTAAAVGTGIVGTTSGAVADASPPDDSFEAERVPSLDLSDVELRLRPVDQYGVPEQANGIRPGSQMFIELADGGTAGCTANFIWRDSRGKAPGKGKAGDFYIGAAGHCFLPSDAAASEKAATPAERKNGEAFDTSKLGTVSVCADCTFGGLAGLAVVEGAVFELGEVVYARQVEPNGDDGPGHDFGLVRVPSNKAEYVDPSLPQWGGPNGVSSDALPVGTPVNQYGAGVANGEVYPTMGSSGASLGGNSDGDTWYAGLRASPGDSGSPIIGAETAGKPGAGILTHLTSFGIAGTTIGQCQAMVKRDIGRKVEVVQPGT